MVSQRVKIPSSSSLPCDMSLRTLSLSSVLSGLLCLCKQLAPVTFPRRRNARNNNTISTNPTQQAMIKMVCLLLICFLCRQLWSGWENPRVRACGPEYGYVCRYGHHASLRVIGCRQSFWFCSEGGPFCGFLWEGARCCWGARGHCCTEGSGG